MRLDYKPEPERFGSNEFCSISISEKKMYLIFAYCIPRTQTKGYFMSLFDTLYTAKSKQIGLNTSSFFRSAAWASGWETPGRHQRDSSQP